MKSRPEIVHFDAATIFGGIIQEGRPKPGDSLPLQGRDQQKELMEPTRRTVKVCTYVPNFMRVEFGKTLKEQYLFRHF